MTRRCAPWLAGPVGLLEVGNVARFVLTDPRARAAFPEWQRVADDQTAHVRARGGSDDPYLAALIEELVAAGAWSAERHPVSPLPPNFTGLERWRHPEVGELRLAYEIMELPAADQTLVVYLPDDEATSTALDRLTGRRPGALRPVPEPASAPTPAAAPAQSQSA